MTRRAAAALILLLLQGCAAATFGGGRYLAEDGPDLTAWRLGRTTDLAGPLSYDLLGVVYHGARGQDGLLLGVGGDLVLLAGRAGSPYLAGGGEAGLGTRDQPGTWAAWSAGAGGQVAALGPFGLRLEARYRSMSASSRRGVELGLRIGRAWGRAQSAARPAGPRPTSSPLPPLTVAGAGGGPAGTLRVAVTTTATEAMGTPYRWGGSGENGFDCSGLIQFAYAQHGLALPRRSVDQARAGEAVPRDPGALLPGDILTFAGQPGGQVNHVGLYLGDGRFIHSATGGVQISLLSADDPYGRWWWQRWLGARRIIP